MIFGAYYTMKVGYKQEEIMANIAHMFVYSLLNDRDDNIEGENFKQFIQYCLQHSTFFSVTLWGDKKDVVIPEFHNFFYKTYQTHLWYRCKTGLEQLLTIKLYHSSPSLLEGIMKHFDRLFPEIICPIEDICFFQDHKLLFGSLSHESIAELILPSEAELKAYEKFAKWKKEAVPTCDYEYYPDLESLV